MSNKIFLVLLVFSAIYFARAQQADDPKFENTSNGQSKFQRIENNVAQINALMGQISGLQSEIEALKARVSKLESE